MKLLLVTTLALATLAAAGHAAESTANTTNRFAVTGMSCDGCARGIAAELKQTAGVISASVSFSNQLAVVICDTNQVNAAQLIKVIEEAGYKAALKK